MICGPCARETVLEVSESLEERKYWIQVLGLSVCKIKIVSK